MMALSLERCFSGKQELGSFEWANIEPFSKEYHLIWQLWRGFTNYLRIWVEGKCKVSTCRTFKWWAGHHLFPMYCLAD